MLNSNKHRVDTRKPSIIMIAKLKIEEKSSWPWFEPETLSSTSSHASGLVFPPSSAPWWSCWVVGCLHWGPAVQRSPFYWPGLIQTWSVLHIHLNSSIQWLGFQHRATVACCFYKFILPPYTEKRPLTFWLLSNQSTLGHIIAQGQLSLRSVLGYKITACYFWNLYDGE